MQENTIVRETLQRKLRETLQIPEKSDELQAVQLYAVCLAMEYLADVLVDLLEQQGNLEERLQTGEMTNGLHSAMLKRLLQPQEYDQIYCECLGVTGKLQ